MPTPLPKRRLDVSKQRRERRTRSVPVLAAAGGLVVVLAGFASVTTGEGEGDSLSPVSYESILAADDGNERDGGEPTVGEGDVSRDYDRADVEERTEDLAVQRQAAVKGITDDAAANEERMEKEAAEKEAAEKKAKKAEEAERKKNEWVLPVSNYRLSAKFGQSSSLWSTVHTGLDFAAPSGEDLKSVAAGEITSTGFDGAYGNRTIVTLEDGTEVWYCHQSSVSVSVGDQVDSGQSIGKVGATGNVTGPHLHLEVRPGGGEPIDPVSALKERGLNP